jgi:hypothetical protein
MYADINLLRRNIYTVRKNMKALIDASNLVSLEVNTGN